MPATHLPTYRIPKAQPYLEFRAQIAQAHKLDPTSIRLWVLVNRQNKTVRPDTPINDQDPTLTMETVRDKMASRQSDLKLYLEHIDPQTKANWTQQHGQEPPIMVFVKHFDQNKQTLRGVGHFYVHRNMRVMDLASMINERMGYLPTTPLKIYEEIKPNMIEVMKMKATFLQSEIQDGDIVCFQVDMTDQAVSDDADRQGAFHNPLQMYDFFLNRVVVHFRHRFESPDFPDFFLTLSKKNTYDQMAHFVGDRLGVDPLKVRFTQSNGANGAPKTVVRRQANSTVAEMIQPGYMATTTNLLYYELLNVSIIELETKKSLRITWVSPTNKDEQSHAFLVPKNTTMHEVAQDYLLKDVTLAEQGGSGHIRIFEIGPGGTTQKIYHGSENVRDVSEATELFAEEILEEELAADEGERVVQVFHFNKDPSRTHGIPFRFVLRPVRGSLSSDMERNILIVVSDHPTQREPFSETKKRLQARTGTSEKELAKMKFAIIQPTVFKQPAPIQDGAY